MITGNTVLKTVPINFVIKGKAIPVTGHGGP
jgi:hypothetical protein